MHVLNPTTIPSFRWINSYTAGNSFPRAARRRSAHLQAEILPRACFPISAGTIRVCWASKQQGTYYLPACPPTYSSYMCVVLELGAQLAACIHPLYLQILSDPVAVLFPITPLRPSDQIDIAGSVHTWYVASSPKQRRKVRWSMVLSRYSIRAKPPGPAPPDEHARESDPLPIKSQMSLCPSAWRADADSTRTLIGRVRLANSSLFVMHTILFFQEVEHCSVSNS